MQVIGNFLLQEAQKRKDFDLFARSAFNRYYYAAFLVARDMYIKVFPGTKVPSHKDFPDIIVTKIRKTIANRTNASRASGLLTPGKANSIKSSVLTMSSEFANLLQESYQARCMADYEPANLVKNDGGVFYLGKTSLSGATKWSDRASFYASVILNAWKELGY